MCHIESQRQADPVHALGFPPTAIIFFCLYMMTYRHPDPDSGLHFVISCCYCSSFQTLNCWGGTTGGWRGTLYWATKILFPSLVAVEHFVLTLTITFGFMQNSEPTGQDYIDCSLHFIFDNLPPTCPPTYPAFQELQKTFCNSWTMFVDLQVLFHFCAIQIISLFFREVCSFVVCAGIQITVLSWNRHAEMNMATHSTYCICWTQ